MARSNAFVPVGFGGPWNPTCASLSCTRLNGVTSSPFCLRNHLRTVAAGPPPAIAGATEISAPIPRDTPETLRNLRRSKCLSISTMELLDLTFHPIAAKPSQNVHRSVNRYAFGVRRLAAALTPAACCRQAEASFGLESGAKAPHSIRLTITPA